MCLDKYIFYVFYLIQWNRFKVLYKKNCIVIIIISDNIEWKKLFPTVISFSFSFFFCYVFTLDLNEIYKCGYERYIDTICNARLSTTINLKYYTGIGNISKFSIL